MCSDLDAAPTQVVAWFVQRWQVEVSFEEVRCHLGVETQRQWSDRAIRRTNPAFLMGRGQVAQTAWYPKEMPTFADVLAEVRAMVWAQQAFPR